MFGIYNFKSLVTGLFDDQMDKLLGLYISFNLLKNMDYYLSWC